MNWKKLLNTHRLGNRPAKTEIGRSPFNADHDKIIFSGAFRRLAKKTQVHPLATNDHIHNRLTHSLEVACVGRSLGIKVGQALQDKQRLPNGFVPTDLGDVVQSACLAHDIGNPPFGHTGEEAIRSWFAQDGYHHIASLTPAERSDLLWFEGNAQGLRVLTSAEYYPYDGGMRLTYSTLAAFIKYPWTSEPMDAGLRPKPDKYGIFQAEIKQLHEIAAAVGLTPQSGENWYCRHPLVYLMEAADDFCYGILDLEDGLRMELIGWDDIFRILKPVLPKDKLPELQTCLDQVAIGRKASLIRGPVISAYIDAMAETFIRHEPALLRGEYLDLIALCPEPVHHSVLEAKQTAKEKIFSYPRKVELEIGAYHVISTLLEVMCGAVNEWISNPLDMRFKTKRVMDLIGPDTFDPRINQPEQDLTSRYLAILRVIDFVGGMTDHYATYLAKQFNGMGEGR